MTLFAPDLYRNFALGFAAGAAILAISNFDAWSDQISPPAQAAEMVKTPQPSAEFWTIDEQ